MYVQGDGSWRKPGFDSLQGFTTLIGHETQKVIDVDARNKFCRECELMEPKCGSQEYFDWLEEHAVSGKCQVNHEGSSAIMEVNSVIAMFMRSEKKHGVQYHYYIGDGDAKTHKAIVEAKPYDNVVKKKEDLNHLRKRFGTRVRTLKDSLKGKKLADGKLFTGIGRMTGKKIDILQQFFGNAIRENCDSIPKMEKAVKACHQHYLDKHSYCPSGENSWCQWQVAKAKGKNMRNFKMTHKIDIPKECMKAMIPTYEALSSHELLEACLGGYSQNSNECLNSVVWRIAPKKYFSGLPILEIGINMGVATFNDGQNAILDLMTELNILPGHNAVQGTFKADARRLHAAEVQATATTMEARRVARQARIQAKEANEAAEGAVYAAGAF